MSKELEALERLYIHLEDDDLSYAWSEQAKEDKKIVKQALKDYENLKLSLFPHPQKNGEEYRQNAIKRLLALEIIKEKQVDIYLLCTCNSVDEYNSMFEHRFGSYDERALTQEEYDLLKEVLKCVKD